MSLFDLIPSKQLLYKDRRLKTLSIEPVDFDDPSIKLEGATIKLSSKGYLPRNDYISVKKDTTVEYEVSKKYYHTSTGKINVRKNMVLQVPLKEYVRWTLTINVVDHPDAEITFTSIDGGLISNNEFWVHNGSIISYSVYKPGYFTVRGTITMNEDKVIPVVLSDDYGIVYPHEIGNPLLIYTSTQEIDIV